MALTFGKLTGICFVSALVSQAQSAQQQNFGQASTFAQAVLKDQELLPFYEALGQQRKLPAYAAAMSDALKRPSIEGLDLSEYSGQAGDLICFVAKDNGGVVKAVVAITNGNGTTYEEGWAVGIDGDTGMWTYTTQRAIPAGTAVMVNLRVSDRPGNVTELNEEKAF